MKRQARKIINRIPPSAHEIPGYASLTACSSRERRNDRNQTPQKAPRLRRVTIACNPAAPEPSALRASNEFSAHACTLEAMRTQGGFSSAMPFNANLPAEFENWAFRAFRQRASADVFAERDEQAVDLDPVTAREFAFERDRSLLGRSRPDVSPTVGDAMHVYVGADARLTAGDSQHKVGAFRPDALKREQRLGFARQCAFIFINDASRDPEDLLRFAFVKCAGADQLIDFTRREPADFERRARPREESLRRRDGYFVARADRDDACHDLLERGTEAVVGQFEHRGFGERPHRHPDAADDLINVKGPLRDRHNAPASRRCFSFSAGLKRSPFLSILFRFPILRSRSPLNSFALKARLAATGRVSGGAFARSFFTGRSPLA